MLNNGALLLPSHALIILLVDLLFVLPLTLQSSLFTISADDPFLPVPYKRLELFGQKHLFFLFTGAVAISFQNFGKERVNSFRKGTKYIKEKMNCEVLSWNVKSLFQREVRVRESQNSILHNKLLF